MLTIQDLEDISWIYNWQENGCKRKEMIGFLLRHRDPYGMLEGLSNLGIIKSEDYKNILDSNL